MVDKKHTNDNRNGKKSYAATIKKAQEERAAQETAKQVKEEAIKRLTGSYFRAKRALGYENEISAVSGWAEALGKGLAADYSLDKICGLLEACNMNPTPEAINSRLQPLVDIYFDEKRSGNTGRSPSGLSHTTAIKKGIIGPQRKGSRLIRSHGGGSSYLS